MKDLWKIAFGVVCGLLGGGLIVLLSRPPSGPAVTLLPPPTRGVLMVHVAGAVQSPGVYRLPVGCRVQEAIDAAGGLQAQADLNNLNLAAWVEDGAQVYVPTLAPTLAPTATFSSQELQSVVATVVSRANPTAIPFQSPSELSPVNLNTADQAELESLPNIGDYRARQIIAYRKVYGPFKKVEDLLKVPGIPRTTYEIIKDLVTLGEAEATPLPGATPTVRDLE